MRDRFLIKAALSDSFISSVQRGRVYVPDLLDTQKRPFKDAFKDQLRSLETTYRGTVTDDAHLSCIETFAHDLSRTHGGLLRGSRLRIGIAQKGVNLYLKYLWCLGRIPNPPHCPVDAIVMRAIRGQHKWTQLDCIDTYRDIITECRRAAGRQSLSEWELDLWNRQAP